MKRRREESTRRCVPDLTSRWIPGFCLIRLSVLLICLHRQVVNRVEAFQVHFSTPPQIRNRWCSGKFPRSSGRVLFSHRPNDEEPTSFSTETNDGSTISSLDALSDRQKGVLVLLSVPVAWGTFEPAVRFVYAIDPPIPAFLFSFAYYLVAATSLILASAIAGMKDKEPMDTSDSGWPMKGGIELGSYLFVGNALQVLGLQTVNSDRAAFLLQLTTIFVPLAQAGIARDLLAISARTWAACGIALLGVAIMGLDGQDSSSLSEQQPAIDRLLQLGSNWSGGDLFIVGAAVAYTFHCIRLELYAKTTSAVRLATCKAFTETVLSLTSVVGLILFSMQSGVPPGTSEIKSSVSTFASQSGQDIVNFMSTTLNGVTEGSLQMNVVISAIAAVIWTGLVTCAYTIYAQSYGQSKVPPVTANLIYTIQPICTALVAWIVLGETLGPAGYAGGGLIGSAVLLVATDQAPGKEN